MDGLPLHVPNQGPGPERRQVPCPRSDPVILALRKNMLKLWNRLDVSSTCPLPLTHWPRKSKRIFSLHILLLLFKYSWLRFPPISPPIPAILTHPIDPTHFDPTPFGFVHVSFIQKSCPFSPHYPHRPPLWLLSVSSLLHCFWLYLACFFVLFIRFPL